MKTNDIPLNSVTESQLETYLDQPCHALGLVVPVNDVSLKLTDGIVENLLQDNVERLINAGRLLILEPAESKSEISIDSVRQAIKKMSIKTSTDSKRLVLIRNAGKLSHPAQNALLKTLEEPLQNNLLLLLMESTAELLPTIVSRLNLIDIKPLSLKEAREFYNLRYSSSAVDTAWSLSEGEVTLMAQLLDGEEHELKKAVSQAKVFLRASGLDKLLVLDEISKDQKQFDVFLQALSRVLKAAHHLGLLKNSTAGSRLLEARSLTIESLIMLRANTSPKLIALRLATSLKV